jgi:chromosome segregation ATPase
MYNLEEFPPPDRRHPAKPVRREKTDRPAAESPAIGRVAATGASRNGRGPSRWIHFAALVAVAGGAAGGTYIWIDRRMSELEGNLAHALTSLEDAGGSLRLLWNTTTKLDENQAARQALLQDSILSVKSFVESELGKLWETAYRDHESRLAQNSARLRSHDASLRQLADATGRTNIRLDALLSQNRTLEQNLNGVNETAAALRQTLTALTAQLQELQGQLSTARVAQTQIATRVDGVENWVDGFREENLSAEQVRDRLATLARDLRVVASRVDSLRTQSDAVGNARPR